MKLHKMAMASGLALLAMQANAQSFVTVAAGPAPAGFEYAAPSFSTGDSSLAYLATDSVASVRTEPLFDSNSYLIVSTGGSATITFAPETTSFSFLWGSPDQTNNIDLVTSTGSQSLTGLGLFGAVANSDNANTQWFTINADQGQTLNSMTLTTGQIAFEMAVLTPVPEPETYALMLGGLGALAFLARRRKA